MWGRRSERGRLPDLDWEGRPAKVVPGRNSFEKGTDNFILSLLENREVMDADERLLVSFPSA